MEKIKLEGELLEIAQRFYECMKSIERDKEIMRTLFWAATCSELSIKQDERLVCVFAKDGSNDVYVTLDTDSDADADTDADADAVLAKTAKAFK